MIWNLKLSNVDWYDECTYMIDEDFYHDYDIKIDSVLMSFRFRLEMNENKDERKDIEDMSIKSLKRYFLGLNQCLSLEDVAGPTEITIHRESISCTIETQFELSKKFSKENEKRIAYMITALREYIDIMVFLDKIEKAFNDKEFTDTSNKESYKAYAPYRKFYKFFRETVLKSLTDEERLLIESKQI